MNEEILLKTDGEYSGYENILAVLEEQMSISKENIILLVGEIASEISVRLSQEVLPELIIRVNELNSVMEQSSEQSRLVTAGMSAFDAAVTALNIVLFVQDMQNLVQGMKNFEAATKAGAAAQELLNLAQKSSPTGLAIAGIAALTAGVISYASAQTSAIDNIKKAHNESIDAIEKNIASETAEAEQVLLLKNYLFALDTQIRRGTLSELESAEAKEKIATIASKLEAIIPGISDAIYDETGELNVQYDAISNLTNSYYELAMAKSLANGYNSKMQQTANAIVDTKTKIKELKEEIKAPLPSITIGEKTYIAKPATDTKYALKKKLGETEEYLDELESEYRSQFSDYQSEVNKIIALTPKTDNSDDITKYTSRSSTRTNPAKQARDELDNIYKMGEISTDEYYKRIGVIRDTYLAEGSEEWKKYTLELIEYEQEKIKEGLESELALIDEAHKNGELSDAEYYKALQAYRDKYFTEGCANWDKYTDDIFKINEECIASQKEAIRGVFDDITKYADDSINSVLEKRNALEDKLKGEGGFFKKVTINDGNGEETLFTFGNIDEYKKTSEEFTNALVEAEKRLKDTGLMTNEQITAVMDEMMAMSAKEGTTAANSIIRASDMELNNAVEDFLAWYEATEKGAADVYQDEYEDTVDKISKYMTEAFSTAGLEIPEGFFDIGSVSADNFASAFKEKLNLQLKDVLAGIDGIVQEGDGTVVEGVASSENTPDALGTAEGAVIDSTSEAVTAEAAQETGMRTEANGEYIEAVDENVEYMKEEFAKAGLEIPNGFFDTGILSAQRFGEAFKEELDRQFAEIRRRVREFNQSLVINTESGAVNGIKLDSSDSGTTVNQTFNVGSEKETSRQQIENWRNAQEFSTRAGV